MRIILAALLTAMATFQSSTGDGLRLTIYSDGASCPGGCDAHFVTHSTTNGTRFVFDPASTRASPRRCQAGRDCRICFSEADTSCMTALYRGGGPHERTIDGTPAFFEYQCARSDIPVQLRAYCDTMDRNIERLRYRTRVNCPATPSDPRCTAIIGPARAAALADTPRLAECRRLGETAYNRRQTDPNMRRSLDCLYTERALGGPNSAGRRWRKLLPAACRPGSYVGRDGLDCCSSDLRFAASNHRECGGFFPEP